MSRRGDQARAPTGDPLGGLLLFEGDYFDCKLLEQDSTTGTPSSLPLAKAEIDRADLL